MNRAVGRVAWYLVSATVVSDVFNRVLCICTNPAFQLGESHSVPSWKQMYDWDSRKSDLVTDVLSPKLV